MPNIVPGAIWRPIPIDYSRRPKRRKGRGLIGHIAVSSSPDLRGNPNGNNWHFYLPEAGPAVQQIDLDYVSACSRAGDATCATFESQGGLGPIAEVNRQRWNANQAWWSARILRHLHDTEGVPLEVMPDSRTTSRGFATHRHGIDPYRVAGGESWSTSYAKACPGDGRHAQRQEIVDLARTLGDDMSAEDVKQINEWTNFRINQLAGFVRGELRAEVVGRIAGLAEVVKQLAENQGTPIDMAAVEAVVEKGVRDAIAGIETTVTVKSDA